MWSDKREGYSLIELILSIGLFAILIGATVPVYRTFQVHNDLTLAAGVVAQSVRRAQAQARGSANDASWGVYVQSGSVTVFEGTDYASRTVAEDDVYVLGSGIAPSGVQEVVFTGLDVSPSATGSLTLTGPEGSTETVTIGAYGQVAY